MFKLLQRKIAHANAVAVSAASVTTAAAAALTTSSVTANGQPITSAPLRPDAEQIESLPVVAVDANNNRIVDAPASRRVATTNDLNVLSNASARPALQPRQLNQ
jgi:hypothetical protein